MFARLYRPKNLICLVTATFGLFVFFQVYVLIPNTADRRKDLKRQDENYEDVAMEMHQAKKSRGRKNGQNKDLDLLENINRNVNKNKFGKSKFREALKPMYDAQNDEEGAPDEANIDALIKKRDRVFADTDEGGRADDTPRQAVLPVAPQDEKPRPPRGVEQFKPPQDVKPARLSGRYNIAGVNHIRESNDTEPLTIMLREIASRGNAKSPNTTVADVQFNKFSEACTVNVRQNPNRETPFKIYILNLPARYNTDLLKCVDRTHTDGCFKTSHCGLGPEMYNEHSQDFSARDTWQFSLEVIMHHKLLLSPYRTFNVDEADAIYVPYYAAADCFCSQLPSDFPTVEENIPKLIGLIRNQGPFVAKRQPYIMTLGKIEREHMTGTCPWLVQTMVSLEFTYIGIEQESNINLRYQLRKASPPLILAPYPSYGHLLTGRGKKYLGSLYRSGRPVFLLLAAGTRRSNYFRSQVLDQFKGNLTNNNFEKYMERAGTGGHDIAMVHYATPECRGDHNQHTLDWMKRSVFCLQPPGDSPTRKSIYDAIISGCIPVFFQQSEIVRLPFEAQLKYETFSVTIPSTLVNDETNLFVYLRATYTDATITSLQRHLKGVAQYFQYSFPISNDDHNDAVKLILDTIKEKVLGLV